MKIRLEYFTPADFKQLINWIADEELLINWSGALFTFPLTEAKLAWYLQDANNPEKSDVLIFKGVNSETGAVVGHISLGGISRKNKSARISRVMVGDTQTRGKGYCSHMVKAVLEVGFDQFNLHRITLGVYDVNKSAIRCYEKAGFRTEGKLRDVLRYQDSYWSLVEMSMLEDEWREINRLAQAA